MSLFDESKPASYVMGRYEEEKSCRVKQLFKSCLVETACITFLIQVTCMYGVTSKVINSLKVFSVSVLSANILLKSGLSYIQHRSIKDHSQQDVSTQSEAQADNVTGEFNQWIAPFNFALFFGTTGNLLIHEVGHISAALLVYKGLNAQITIPGLFRGAVSWTKTGLTPIGTSLGGINSRILVCVAGPLLSVAVATSGLIGGIHLNDRLPEFSKYVILSSIITLFYQMIYALSGLWASKHDLCHDFNMLWRVGVHPVIASILLASIPLLGVSVYLRLCKSSTFSS